MKFANHARKTLLFLAILMAATAFYAAWNNALAPDGTKDFQYSGARLLAHGINPYEAWHTARGEFILSQVPNYLPTIYVLLLPLGALPWPVAKMIWLVINSCLALFVAYRIWRNPALPAGTGVFAALLFLSATPVRNTIGNGQLGILVMACVIAGYSSPRPWLRGAALAVAASKYSLGGVFIALLAARRAWPALAVAGAVTLGAYAFLGAVTGTPIGPGLLLAPLETARGGVMLEMPFAGVVRLLGRQGPLLISGAALAGVFIWAWVRDHARQPTTATHLAPPGDSAAIPRMVLVASVVTLAGMPHLIYDYCFLALPLAFGNPFTLLGRTGGALFACVLAWYWNGIKLMPLLHSQILTDAAAIMATAMLAYVAWDAAAGKRPAATGAGGQASLSC